MNARKIFFVLGLLLIGSMGIMAQHKGREHFNPDEFKQKMEQHIIQHAKLTPEEAGKFFPIFHEMKEKQHQLQEQIFKLKKEKPSFNATEKDFQNAIMSIKSLNVQMAEVEETYYKRMCKAISAKKVYDAMNAEDAFYRRMFSRFKNDNRKK
ncbi:MAG: hypothetical protein K5945_04950 [Bacteroidaceae bacterium]|nr:hypothetical protein [Bacteroidaceae bacterium]